MKVLILHHHFKTPQSGGAIRSYYLAKALVEKGHRTVVITTHNQSNYKKEDLEGIEVHYLPIAYDNRFHFYQRIRSFIDYLLKSVALAKNFKDFDYCYAISVPLTIGIAALRIKRKYGIPFIFEVGDLWPDAPIQMGFVNNFFLKQYLFALEKKIYQKAESIVALSPSIKASIQKKSPSKTVHIIPNMADTQFYKPEPKISEFEKKYQVQGRFVVSYIGALGLANGLDYFIECARASQKADLPVHFILCGDGAMRDYLISTSEKLQLKNLTVVPFQDRDGVRELMNITDASFICYKPIPILETGSPNKYFDGLAAGKLIMINFGGWIKKEIEDECCGVYIDPNQPSAFAKMIAPFLQNAQQLQNHQSAARTLAERKYSRIELSKKFTALIK